MSKSSKPKKLKTEDLQQQIGELTEALQRERADNTNIRRQHQEQVSSLKTLVKADVVRELLPVVDSIDRALKHAPKDLDDNDYVKGVQKVAEQFEKSLTQIGVSRIQTVGVEFNPELHEAVSMEEGEGEIEVVCEELQSGFQLEDYVIRHAMVRVKMGEKK
jgi:molecular chaperone GrpE